jgi:ligand-binding sensor domain-containing protein
MINEGGFISLIQAPDGFIWMGAFGALAAYDGETYRYFAFDPKDSTSVTFGDLVQLAYDNRGYIWAGSNIGGVSALNLQTGKCVNYYSTPSDLSTIAGDAVSGLTIDRQGNVWVATNNFALSRIDSAGLITRFGPALPDTAKSYADAGSLNEIIEDRRHDGMFWVNSRYGLYRFLAQSNSFQLIKPSRMGSEVEMEFVDIVQDHAGRLWLSTYAKGLWCYDPALDSWREFKAVSGAAESRITNVVRDLICTRDNRIIGTSHSEGLWIVDADSDSLNIYAPPDNDVMSYILGSPAIMEDAQGDLWLGRRKLIRLTERTPPFGYFRFSPYLSTRVKGNWQREYVDDPVTGNFFIGTSTGDGLLEVNMKSGSVIPHRYKANESETVYDVLMEAIALAGDTGVWIGSADGLLFYDRRSGSVRKVVDDDPDRADFLNSLIRSIIVDERGDLWMASDRRGLVRWNPGTGSWKQFLDPVPGNSGILREVRKSPRGELWLAFDEDVAVLDPGSGRMTFVPHGRSGTGLSMHVVREIELDSAGDAWVSTMGGGINRVTLNADGTFLFRYFTTSDGLPSAFVYELEIGNDGRIWAGTREGLAVIDPVTEGIMAYNATDGLGFNARGGALHQLRSGEILSGGRGGFHFAHVDSLELNSQVPRPYLYQLETADGTSLLSFIDQVQVSIGPSDNFFTVTWGAIAFDETPKTRYAYKLEGFDDDWVIAGDRTFARYAKLPGGDYVFRLKAANDQGQWSDELAMLHVHIVPPFTRTIWFYLLVAAAVLALLYAFYRIRVRRVRRESELKAQFDRELAQVEMHALRAQMNPHFLFNSLNSINRFIVKNDSKAASKYLTRFSRLIRLILDNSKSNKVTLANELEAIRLYVELESLRFDDKFSFELEVADNVEPENVEIDSMILQPYIENAIWHGLMHKDGHGTLHVSISRNHTALTCVVEDDGVGRAKAAELKSKSAVKEKSYGMKITSDRLRMLNNENQAGASVEVTDLVNASGEPSGTRVKINLPC